MTRQRSSGNGGRSEVVHAVGSNGALRFLNLVFVALSLCLLITLSPCHLVTLSFCQGEESAKRLELPDIRRQFLPPERLSQELKRVQDGVLVRLPIAEFEARVEEATRSRAHKVPPQLVEAHYHAVLKDESLVGDGQWKVVHKVPQPGLLTLKSFNLALRQMRFENGDALVAAFDGRTPALLVETEGEQKVFLEWSARAEAGPEGLQFHLEVPPCPVALLELDVPDGRAVSMLDDSLLSGPYSTEKPGHRRWKIVCGGRFQRSEINFRVRDADRPNTETDPPPVKFVRQTTTQKLCPEGLDAVFELTLEPLSQAVRELVCECDPELRPRDVIGPNVDGWTFREGNEKSPSRIIIHLREPLYEGKWQISCLAPLSNSPALSGPAPTIAWRSPSLRLIGSVPRGETLDLWFHPDLRIESWNLGSFRLTKLTNDYDALRQVRMQHLALVGGSVVPEGSNTNLPPRRPEARLRAYGVEFRARQLAWWRCNADNMTLTLQIGYEVSQGQLFQLPILLPAGWAVERVEMNPAHLLRDSRVRPSAERAVADKGRSILYVDLTRPLVSTDESRHEEGLRPRRLLPPEGLDDEPSHPSTPARPRVPTLTVHLRPAWSGTATDRPLPFPDAVPLGALFREGALALDCDEQLFHLDVRMSVDRSEPEDDGPWGKQTPNYYYRYQGRPLEGTLRIQPRPPRVRAKCSSEVFVSSGRAAVETHLLLEAEVGSPDTIDLSLSASSGSPWEWHNEPDRKSDGEAAESPNRIHRAERLYAAETARTLHLLAAHNPLHAAALFIALPPTERWRLTLAKPLGAQEPLRLYTTRNLELRDNHWYVPLPVVLGASRMEGEVTLHLAGADLMQVHTVGLREASSAAARDATTWRTFRYGQTEVVLMMEGHTGAASRSSAAAINHAQLTTYVCPGGVLRHHFSFQVANWEQHALPLRLPAGSRPLAVQVDGRWLPRLVASSPTIAENVDVLNDPVELSLPVPGSGDSSVQTVHRFEILYIRTVPTWFPWQSIEAPTPTLPVTPLSFRRIWRLPPGLTPLRDGRYQAMPGTQNDFVSGVLPHQPSDLFRLPALGPPLSPLLGSSEVGAQEALVRAVEELRGNRGGQTASLSEILSEISFAHLKDRYPLVVDTLALREASVGMDTLLTIHPLSAKEQDPPWVECGLRAVPIHSTILLTSVSGRGAFIHEPLPEPFEQAIAEAVTRGQDSSGRFRSSLSWLRPENGLTSSSAQPRLLGLDSDVGNWSEWEPVAGLEDDTLFVVRRELVTGVGLALTVTLALLFWMIRRYSTRWRLAFLFLALGVLGLGLLWLPGALQELAWWPLLTAGAGAFLWYLRGIARGTHSSATRSHVAGSAATAVSLLLAVVAGWSGRAAAPTPVTVYLVPGPPESPENQTVLAPADLLNRLKALARPAPLVADGPLAVLLGASYEGKLVDKEAEFATVFSVHCFTDEPTMLAIPLDGVQLVGDVWLDGARAHPLALPAPHGGYSLKVRGRGRHQLELRFRASVVGTSEDRNVLFTIPLLARSHLNWRVPAGATYTEALVKHGAQWMVRDGAGERLEVDLGRLETPVHLHWHQPVQPAQPTRVEYQAAYLWDLHLESSRLTAWVRYHVPQGAIKTLEVDLPDDLEVRSVSAQRTLPGTSPAWLGGARLRRWHVAVAEGRRTLYLEFPYPLAGDFQIMMELVPRTPLPAVVTLSLPVPHGERSSGLHYLAYRTHPGLEAQRDISQNITRISENKFASGWQGLARSDPSSTGAAFKISPDRVPVLRLHLRRSPPLMRAELDIAVQVSRQLAQVQAAVELKAPNKDLGVIEWDLQPPRFTVASVTGPDVRSWKQTEGRLLVWLQRTTASTRLQLSGWLPLDVQAVQAHLDLPCLRLIQVPDQHTRLRLVVAPGLRLAEVQPHNLQSVVPSLTERGLGEHELVFETRQLHYGGTCKVQSAANAVAQVLTFAEVNDRRLQFTTMVDYNVQHGELRSVHLRLRNWEAGKVEFSKDGVTQHRELRRAPGDRSLLLELQPGITKHYRVTLRGSIPIEEADVDVLMPDISVLGVEHAEYVVALMGSELAGEARGALSDLANPSQELLGWPGAAEQFERTRCRAWRVQGTEWQLRLLLQTRANERAQIQVFLLEQSAAVMDGRRWLHEAHAWVKHEAHTDLNVELPAAAHVVAASVDGVEVTPVQPNASRLLLPLPGRDGVHSVRFRWLFDEAESLDHPNLAPPVLVDARKGLALWTVLVPPGWEVARNTLSALGVGSAREGALALHRAEAQLRISQQLCKRRRDRSSPDSLAASQRRFALYCHHARHALDMGAGRSGVMGPAGQTLDEWLWKLQADNRELAHQNNFDDLRDEAERRAASGKTVDLDLSADEDSMARFISLSRKRVGSTAGPLPQQGAPISWSFRPDTEPLFLQLASRESQRARHALATSGQWLGVLAVIWVLSFFPFLLARLRLFWPEQIALLGILGWYLAGVTPVVLFLLLLAVCGRVFLLARGSRFLFPKRRRRPSTMTANNRVGS